MFLLANWSFKTNGHKSEGIACSQLVSAWLFAFADKINSLAQPTGDLRKSLGRTEIQSHNLDVSF
jgi:hypothetical protein